MNPTKATVAYFGDALPHFLAYFGVSIILALVFLAAYVAITPHKEFSLIKAGNTAAATQLVGSFLGFAIPVAVIIGHSLTILDMVLWAVTALIIQLIVFFVISKFAPAIEKRIEENCVASGLFIGGTSMAFGILQAGCMIP